MSSTNLRKAVITGGLGFIGTHLARRLRESGEWKVAIIDNDLPKGSRSFVYHDVSEVLGKSYVDHKITLVPVMAGLKPDVIFHLAAQSDVDSSVAYPVFDLFNNVVGSLCVMEAAVVCGAKLVFASSGGTIYGRGSKHLSQSEDDGFGGQPLSPYGCGKKAVGDLLCAFEGLFGLEFVNLALGNVYGDGCHGVISEFFNCLFHGVQPVIYGDGQATRDFVHVDDVVKAFVRAVDHGAGELINVGTGVGTSIVDLYGLVQDLTGIEKEPLFEPGRPGEVPFSCLSVVKARHVLGWVPSVALADGLLQLLCSLKGSFGSV